MNSIYINDISKSQGRLFAYAAKEEYDMEIFSNIFMNSELGNLEMDSEYYAYNSSDGMELESFLNEELSNGFIMPKTNHPDSLSQDVEVAKWIGYMYRYLACTKHIPTKQIFAKLPYQRMVQLWIGGHTLSNEEALALFDV